jgi:hypothetical protein
MPPQPSRSIVFVVDDESIIASTFELILISSGFDARSFVDPLEASKLRSLPPLTCCSRMS